MLHLRSPRLLLARKKLTKTFFFSLSPGVYLASNLFVTPSRPAYRSYVSGKAERSQQWRNVPKCVRQRLCGVFRCKADADAWLLVLVLGSTGAAATSTILFQNN
jgi:hypothetical protein